MQTEFLVVSEWYTGPMVAAGRFREVGYLILKWLEATDDGKLIGPRIYLGRALSDEEFTAGLVGCEIVTFKKAATTPIFIVEPGREWDRVFFSSPPESVFLAASLPHKIDLMLPGAEVAISEPLAWELSNESCAAIRRLVEAKWGRSFSEA